MFLFIVMVQTGLSIKAMKKILLFIVVIAACSAQKPVAPAVSLKLTEARIALLEAENRIHVSAAQHAQLVKQHEAAQAAMTAAIEEARKDAKVSPRCQIEAMKGGGYRFIEVKDGKVIPCK